MSDVQSLCPTLDSHAKTDHRSGRVAQLVQRRLRDPKDPRFEARPEHKKSFESISESKFSECGLVGSVCPTPMCIRTHKNDHVRTFKIPVPHVGGLRKHEKSQHVLAGLGSSALAAAVALPARISRKGFFF